jgi:acetyl esterase/lipase
MTSFPRQSNLSAQAPPTLILATQKDGLAPTESVIRFARKASEAEIQMERVLIPFANHAYDQVASNSIGNQLRLSVTERFLREQGPAPDRRE